MVAHLSDGDTIFQVDSHRVERAIAALSADHARQGGRILQRQVDRYLDKKRLSAEECGVVLAALGRAGIEIKSDHPGGRSAGVPGAATRRRSQGAGFADGLTAVLRDSRAQTLLTAQEEKDLGRAIALGLRAESGGEGREKMSAPLRGVVARGKSARERMIVSNVRLVLDIASRYRLMSDIAIEDLFQEGICGLMRAVEKFDHERGFKFSTYATWWIRQAITRAIADKGRLVRFPVHLIERINKYKRACRVLARMNDGHRPTTKQLVAELAWEPEAVQFIADLSKYVGVSVQQPIASDVEMTLEDVLPSTEPQPDELAELEDQAAVLNVCLLGLTKREADVVRKRFGIPNDGDMTLEEVGQQYGLTRERIRQIEAKALRKLRHPVRSDLLRPLLNLPDRYPNGVSTSDGGDGDPQNE
jgi:RNA polymerase primary sigma factor